MVRYPNRDTDLFDILDAIIQFDKLVPFLFVIILDSVFEISLDALIEIRFTFLEESSSRYLGKKFTNTDYTDDPTLIANPIANATKLLIKILVIM